MPTHRLERIHASPRFNGRMFVNTRPTPLGFKEGVERPTLRDFLCGGVRRIPAGPLPIVDPRPRWSAPPDGALRLTWMGHSSLVIEIEGKRLLTDPVWGARASPLPFAGPKRFHPPPAPLDALPELHAVLLSHDHYDHLDRGTIRRLARLRPDTRFITSLGVGAHLERWGIAESRITELDWWETTEVDGVRVTAGPAQHFSGRGLKDRNATLWSSFHLRGSSSSFFFGADTGLTPEYREIARRLGPFDAVALEIGAYHPAWGDIHMGPANAHTAYSMLGSGLLLPIHWSTFNLAMHAWDEPAETLLRLATESGTPLVMPRLGEPFDPVRGPRVDPWWRSVGGEEAPAIDGGDVALAAKGEVQWLAD